MTLIPPQGFRWQLSFGEIQVSTEWSFTFQRGWIKFGDRGRADVTLKDLSFDVTLDPEVHDGNFDAELSFFWVSCYGNDRKFYAKFSVLGV